MTHPALALRQRDPKVYGCVAAHALARRGLAEEGDGRRERALDGDEIARVGDEEGGRAGRQGEQQVQPHMSMKGVMRE